MRRNQITPWDGGRERNSYSMNNLWYSEAWKIQERAWWVKLHARCRIKVFTTRKFMTIHQSCRFFIESWDKSFVFMLRLFVTKIIFHHFAAIQSWYKYYLQDWKYAKSIPRNWEVKCLQLQQLWSKCGTHKKCLTARSVKSWCSELLRTNRPSSDHKL